MSRTYRRKPTKLKLGKHLGHKQHKSGDVRDGTPTRYTKSCENHGGCPYCEGNKKHSTNRRKPLEDV